jgi:hypothetical protein
MKSQPRDLKTNYMNNPEKNSCDILVNNTKSRYVLFFRNPDQKVG